MSTRVTQVKITLPDQLHDYASSQAGKFGLTLSSYIKHLIITDVKDMEIPVFEISEEREKVGMKALEDHKNGKTTKIEDIDAFFSEL